MNLKVPFAEKDQAKKLGARWDPALKVWYVAGALDAAAFAQWSPSPHGGGAVGGGGQSSPRLESAGKLVVGSAFSEVVRVCECLPWDVCARCEPTSLKKQP
jgi:hypothetical protein